MLCCMASLHDAALQVFSALDRLRIRYAVGGSFASSFHGIARATQDLDVVVELTEEGARELFQAVAPDFYADEKTMLDAIRRGTLSCRGGAVSEGSCFRRATGSHRERNGSLVTYSLRYPYEVGWR